DTVTSDTYTVTIRITDENGAIDTHVVVARVNKAIEISGGSDIITTEGVSRSSAIFGSTFGTGALTYSIKQQDGNQVQSGITISQSGVVTIAETATSETVTVVITVTDAVGATRTASLVITINPPLIINGGSDVLTTFGRADAATAFGYTGGTAPHVFTITRIGGTLPAGITIDSITGIISVAATTPADTYTIEVTITDSVTAVDTALMTIRVNPAIAITGADTVTTTYSIETSTTYVATGGTTASSGGAGVLTFALTSITSSPSLDTSTISIHPTSGLLTTTETTPAGTYTIVITVSDSLSVTGTKTVRLVVNESVTIANGGDVTTTFGRAWSSGQFTGTLGTGSRTYQIVRENSGQAYPGITISDTGVVRVSDTVPVDTYVMTITLTDSVGDSTTINMTIVVNETVTLSGGSNILTTYARAESSSAFVAARGTPAYTYSIEGISAENGSATTGISIDPITGVVLAAGGTNSGSGLTAYVYYDPTQGASPPIPGVQPSSVSLGNGNFPLSTYSWVEMTSPWSDKLIRTTTVSDINYN
ncbi:MAG: putative Ig domain-containing protein, partial [Candidatus Nanopelagicaceae bacterium]